MTTYQIIKKNGLTENEREQYQRFYKDHEVTRDLMEVRTSADNGNTGSYITLIIVRGNYTPSGCVRECNGYYIRALYSRYDRIETFHDLPVITRVIKDVEDC